MRTITKHFYIVIIICIFLGETATTSYCESPHERLNGLWVNDIMTAEIDFDQETYTGIAMGKPFSHKLTLIKEYANIVIFKSDDSTITAQLQENGNVMLTKEGGIPLIFKRATQ